MYNTIRYDCLKHMLEAVRWLIRIETDSLNQASDKMRHRFTLASLELHQANIEREMGIQYQIALVKAKALLPGMKSCYKEMAALNKIRSAVEQETGVLIDIRAI